MDLLKLSYMDEGADLHLRNPTTGEPIVENGEPTILKVISQQSSTWLNIQNEEMLQRTEELRERAKDKDPKKKPTLQEMNDAAIRVAASAVVGWSGVSIGSNGPLEYSKENALLLITKFPWIRRQVQEFMTDEGNFIKDCSTASSSGS
jgi:hypothetical protein